MSNSTSLQFGKRTQELFREELPLEVLELRSGHFGIGTYHHSGTYHHFEEMPDLRRIACCESVGTWPTYQAAQAALDSGEWVQKSKAKVFGQDAQQLFREEWVLKVIQSERTGQFFIGTRFSANEEGLENTVATFESLEVWPTYEAAENALESGEWTQEPEASKLDHIFGYLHIKYQILDFKIRDVLWHVGNAWRATRKAWSL